MQLACKLGTDMHFLSFISLSTLVLVYQTLTNQVFKQLERGMPRVMPKFLKTFNGNTAHKNFYFVHGESCSCF